MLNSSSASGVLAFCDAKRPIFVLRPEPLQSPVAIGAVLQIAAGHAA